MKKSNKRRNLPGLGLPFILLLSAFFGCMNLISCKDKSTPVTPAGPDTSSNDFVWTKTPIGTYGTVLQDIAAFSDTDVWICGEIHFKDTDETLSFDPGPYVQSGLRWRF